MNMHGFILYEKLNLGIIIRLKDWKENEEKYNFLFDNIKVKKILLFDNYV